MGYTLTDIITVKIDNVKKKLITWHLLACFQVCNMWSQFLIHV